MTVFKNVFKHTLKAFAQINFSKIRATVECTGINFRQTVGQSYLGQTVAVTETGVGNRFEIVGENNFGHSSTAEKCGAFKNFNAFGNNNFR